MAWKYCPNCMANSIRDTTGICVICKTNFSEEIEASEASLPITSIERSHDMAKKARAKKLTKPEGQPEEKKSRAKKLLEPKPEEKKTRAKKLPKPEPQPEEAPKAKRGPALPDTEKRQLDRAICEMLVQKNLSDEAIAEAMLSNYGDKGIFTTVQRVEYLRDKVNNNGWYARIVQAAGAELPLEQI